MTILLLAVAAVAAAVWVAVLLSHSGSLTPGRRAGIVFALAAFQPLVVLLLSARTVEATGAVSDVSGTVRLLGEAMNIVMLAFAATLVLFPHERAGAAGRLLLGGVWGMALALFVANAFSPSPGSLRYELYFAVGFTAVVLGVPDRVTMMLWGRRVLRVIVAVSLIAAVIAPGWAFIGKGTTGYDRTIFGIPRLTGLSPHPNDLSVIAVLALLLEVGFRNGSRRTAVLAGTAAAACIILAQSNTGYVAAAVGLLTLVAARRASHRAMLAATGLALLAVYLVNPGLLVPRRLTDSSYVDSVSGRTAIWRLSLDEWHRHVLTGYGSNMYSPTYLSSHFPINMQQATNGHDQFVQTLADSGLLGVTALTAVLAGLVFCAWRARRVDGGLAIALVATFLTFGITETPLRVISVAAIPALVILATALAGSRDAETVAVTATAATLQPPGSDLAVA